MGAGLTQQAGASALCWPAPTWIWSKVISVVPCARPMKARMRILASASSALMPAAARAAAPSALPANAW